MTFDEVWENLKSKDPNAYTRAEQMADDFEESIQYAYDQGFKSGYKLGKEERPQVVVFTESTDEKTISELKTELQNVIEERPTWITDRQPDKSGTYLCVVTLKGANVYFRNILSYATDLYEVDNFDFQKYRYKKKTDRAGWYDLDSEYGYIHYEDDEVVAWVELPELPEPYKGEEE